MTAKVDRRVRRTRRLLNEAILELIVEKGIESITIQEITERADLNRATFYLHYGSKEELLAASLETRFDELVSNFDLSVHDVLAWDDCTTELLTFKHVAAHAQLYKVLFGAKGMGYIIFRVINYIANETKRHLQHDIINQATITIPIDIVAQHMAGSLFSLLNWWLQNDMPHSPETMATFSQRLCTRGIMDVIEIEESSP